MFILRDNQRFTPVTLYSGKEISIAIDSSKSNTGITVGNKYCEPLDVFELNGTQDGTGEVDVLVLCQRQREFLHTVLAGSKPKIVGIEDIITVKGDSQGQGLKQHMSRFKITAVFMSFIFFFQDEFGITPQLVNNQTWKTVVLPKECNVKSGQKGSQLYFKSINSKYANYSDDATDSLCILKYLKVLNKIANQRYIEYAEVEKYTYDWWIAPSKVAGSDVCRFGYNTELTKEQNMAFMANHIKSDEIGIAIVETGLFSFDEIYKRCLGIFAEKVDEVRLCVRRT